MAVQIAFRRLKPGYSETMSECFTPAFIYQSNSMELKSIPETTPEIIVDTASLPVEEPLYRVIIHNDDVTPMDFVVYVLMRIFLLSAPDAMEVMYLAHYIGAAYVQTLPKPEAEKRVNSAHFAAGLEGYPLHFSIEPE
jgi:ATP-dependent Clp protease adaptor protein ClpS